MHSTYPLDQSHKLVHFRPIWASPPITNTTKPMEFRLPALPTTCDATMLPHPASVPLRWRPVQHWPRANRPNLALRDWLSHEGSLTARLQQQSQGYFQVHILRQHLALPHLDERQLLGQYRRPSLALIREVILQGRGEDWVFARSVLPLQSLTGRLRHLRHQGSKPLGAFLFSRPDLARSPIELACISPQQGYVPISLYQQAQHLWGRRSVFYLDRKPLLVSEVFLPSFCQGLAHSQPR